MWQSSERWCSFAAWSIVRWWSYDESLIRFWWFRCKHYWQIFFCAKLGKIDVSKPLPWWFVDAVFVRHCWNIDIFVGSFFDLYCFWCVNLWIIEFTLLVHWRFVDDSLMKHWRYSEDFDANIEDHKRFHRPSLRNIDVSLLLRRRSLMIL